MKIVTWNCNGAFRNKYKYLDELGADIMVVQECEDPMQCSDVGFRTWATNYLWIGDSKHKGLGLFCKEHIQLIKNDWDDNCTKYFISARVNNTFDLIAVWTQRNNSDTYRYIGQFWKFLHINKGNINDCIILGDFNSNKIWDTKHRKCNHSDVVSQLNDLGLVSLYHENYNSLQGKELHPTFYMQRNLEKPYHIDYIFLNKQRYPHVLTLEIGSVMPWLIYSDHLPLITTLNIE